MARRAPVLSLALSTRQRLALGNGSGAVGGADAVDMA